MKYTLKEHEAKKKLTGEELLESVGIVGKIRPETVEKLTESAKGKSKRKLVVQMEAIHVGRTANYTFYTEEGLKAGLESWTHPYNKPVLTHHEAHRGEPVGRILRAEYTESTISGKKGLIFTCEITDPTAVEKVLDGRYQTVSIGATTDKVTCNICGTDRTQEWCGHWKGEEYDGQACHFIVGTTIGREVSYVNVPADENAGNFSVSIDDTEEGDSAESEMQVFQIAEGLMQSTKLPDVNLYESTDSELQQLVDGILNLSEGSAPKVNFKLNESGQVVNESGEVVSESLQKMHTDLSEAQTQLATVKSDLAEAQATLSNMAVAKSKVDEKLVTAEGDVERLTNENADLVAKAHKALAEKVVDMKLALRKSDVVGYTPEEAVEEHIKRTEESLNDAVTDLQAEMQSTNAQRGSIPNPGGTGQDNTPKGQQEEGDGKDKKSPVTMDEAVGMFKGMFSAKHKR
jgi:hypothetical protein